MEEGIISVCTPGARYQPRRNEFTKFNDFTPHLDTRRPKSGDLLGPLEETPEVMGLHSVNAAQIFGMGQQEHFILSAPLGVIIEKWRSLLPDEPVSASSVCALSPQAIWPTTGKWFFAIPFDWNSSFFGGPVDLTVKLLSDVRIEAYEASIEADFRHMPSPEDRSGQR
jgi:hypothetical protein